MYLALTLLASSRLLPSHVPLTNPSNTLAWLACLLALRSSALRNFHYNLFLSSYYICGQRSTRYIFSRIYFVSWVIREFFYFCIAKKFNIAHGYCTSLKWYIRCFILNSLFSLCYSVNYRAIFIFPHRYSLIRSVNCLLIFLHCNQYSGFFSFWLMASGFS